MLRVLVGLVLMASAHLPAGARADEQGTAAALDKVRVKAASLLGCQLDDIILTGSATAGMFLLAQGSSFRPGDRVLTTDHEHPAGRLGWEWVARRYGVEIDTLAIAPGESDPTAIVDLFEAAIRPETRVLSFSHILYTTGVRLPATELCQLARQRGCLAIVDDAQSAGAMPRCP